jgi:hypothetical protein
MRVVREPHGMDADGNRAVDVYMYDLEKEDREEVLEALEEQAPWALDGEDEYATIFLPCPVTGLDVEFDIKVKDWL